MMTISTLYQGNKGSELVVRREARGQVEKHPTEKELAHEQFTNCRVKTYADFRGVKGTDPR
jgi:hypothetical protein